MKGIKEAIELGKLPPQAIEVEQAIIGAMLIESDARTSVLSKIKNVDVFYKEAHSIIFETIQTVFASGSPVDLLTVVSELKKESRLDLAGGAYYLTELTTKVSSGANVEAHIAILKEHWIRRRNIKMAMEMLKSSYDDTIDPLTTLSEFQNQSILIGSELSTRQSKTSKEIVHQALDQIARAKHAYESGEVIGIPSGIVSLDKATGGFQKSDLVIIAARPGMGKTALVLSIAKFASCYANIPVAVFSLEMNAVQLMNRLIADESKMYYSKMSKGKLEDSELMHILNTVGRLRTDNLIIDDTPGISITELRSKASMLKTKFGIQMIIIDYLQLMSGGNSKNANGNREQEISAISRGCKLIAKELDIPVIALSQLSRAVETRGGDKRPQLSDLRESGSIEQDADIVLFPYCPKYYKIDEAEVNGMVVPSDDLMLIGHGKNRNGGLGDVPIRCNLPTNSFSDWNVEKVFSTEKNESPNDNQRFFAGRTSEQFEPIDEEPF